MTRRLLVTALSALALSGVAGSAQAPRAGQAAGTVAGSTITGMVRFDGTAPKPRPIRMEADPLCVPIGKGATFETLMVGAGGGIQNVFVYVKDGLRDRKFPPPTTPVTIDQMGCRYHPHVFGIQVGQPLSIMNSDPVLHNVNTSAKANQEFNLIQPKGVPRGTRKFDKPEVMVAIRCDVHSWMGSWVGVVSHPFYAVTGADGSFTLKGLPAGTYTVEAWHEELGTQTQKVVVDAKKGASTAFVFKPGQKQK